MKKLKNKTSTPSEVYPWHMITDRGRYVCGTCGQYFTGQVFVRGSQYYHVSIMCPACKGKQEDDK